MTFRLYRALTRLHPHERTYRHPPRPLRIQSPRPSMPVQPRVHLMERLSRRASRFLLGRWIVKAGFRFERGQVFRLVFMLSDGLVGECIFRASLAFQRVGCVSDGRKRPPLRGLPIKMDRGFPYQISCQGDRVQLRQ